MSPSKSSKVFWSDLTDAEQLGCKYLCDHSHLYFTRLFFKLREGTRFRTGPHHRVMASVIDQVFAGRISRLIVNVPPGYTKTEMAVVNLVARGLAINPGARFIHASYSDKLVQDNSAKIRDCINLDAYQTLWPLAFKTDTRAKGLWKTAGGGGFLAAAAGGSITGFRAGTMDDGFTGALIIDDPLKPDDARSVAERSRINDRYHGTFRSRLAREDIPIIVIMQRLHVDDFGGFLLKGASGEMWHHLMLPVEIDRSQAYPAQFTHGVALDHGLPDGPLWPEKHDAGQINVLRKDPYVFAGQYAQRPTPDGGALFKDAYLAQKWRELPPLIYRTIYADTAQKTGQSNDFSVFQCWGKGRLDGKAHLIDQVRGKWEAPELLSIAKAFWNKHLEENAHTHGVLREMAVEDKVSGTGLIQSLGRDAIPIRGIARARDKLTRALDVIPQFAIGMVVFPADAIWWPSYQDELLSFTGNGDTHDDQVDPTMDAVNEMLVQTRSMMDVI